MEGEPGRAGRFCRQLQQQQLTGVRVHLEEINALAIGRAIHKFRIGTDVCQNSLLAHVECQSLRGLCCRISKAHQGSRLQECPARREAMKAIEF